MVSDVTQMNDIRVIKFMQELGDIQNVGLAAIAMLSTVYAAVKNRAGEKEADYMLQQILEDIKEGAEQVLSMTKLAFNH